MSSEITGFSTPDIRQALADQISHIVNEECRARLAEAVYRCKAGGINKLTRLVYQVAVCVHGRQKTTALFTRFLLHAHHVKQGNYIEQIIQCGVAGLLAGRLSAQQVHCMQQALVRG